MTEKNGKILSKGDILSQIMANMGLRAGAQWEVIDFGIEYSTKREVCIVKDLKHGYIASAYQNELMYFQKVEN